MVLLGPISEDLVQLGFNGKCRLCGESSNAGWMGSGDGGVATEVCFSCAARILPALLADSFPESHVLDYAKTQTVLDRFEQAFWKAMACRMRVMLKDASRNSPNKKS